MDLRFAAFELLTRDAALRALLVNYADRLDHARAAAGPAPAARFLALAWTDGDGPDDRACSQVLTARVHLPRELADEHAFLDTVLAQLRAALTGPDARGLISARRLPPSRPALEHGVDTIFKTGRFEISPAPARGSGAALRDLAPWTGVPATGGPATSPVVRAALPSVN
jgi:hypothetical protein